MSKHCHNKGLGIFILRFVVGIIFLSHGWEAFVYMPQTIAFFAQFGIPAYFTYLVAIIETVGGIALILGIFTRVMAPLLALIMVFSIALVKWKVGYPVGGFLGAFRISEIDIMLLVSSVTLAISGCGKYSLGRFCRCKCHSKDGKHCGVCKAVGCEESLCGHCSDGHDKCSDSEHSHEHDEHHHNHNHNHNHSGHHHHDEVKISESVREGK
jgi:uncharacterized membrane protein YphA (DoxX/SURF4 family)